VCGEYTYSGLEKYIGKDSSMTWQITSTNNYKIEIDSNNNGTIDITETGIVGNSSSDDDLPVSNNSAPAELKGTWITSECIDDDGDGLKISYTINDNDDLAIYSFFKSDTDCSEPLSYIVTTKSNITFGTKYNLTDGNDAYNQNSTDYTAAYTPISDDDIQWNNDNKYCEYSDWKENTTKDVTSCYDIKDDYNVVGIVNNILYSGNTDGALDGTTESNRANALDTTIELVKQ